MKLLFLSVLIAFATFHNAAAGRPREIREIVAGEPVTIRPDRAYLLLRAIRGAFTIQPVLLRVPTSDELAQYDAARTAALSKAQTKLRRASSRADAQKAVADDSNRSAAEAASFTVDFTDVTNVQAFNASRVFIKGRPESWYLVEVPPGTYVVYGLSLGGGGIKPGLHTCFCLGSVEFDARAGIVTNMGTFLADSAYKPSAIPELTGESGFGPSSDAGFMRLLTGTIRPAEVGAPIPAPLPSTTVEVARYRPVGRFFDPRAIGINRMVPIPGVLDYRGGRVVDPRTGEIIEDHL